MSRMRIILFILLILVFSPSHAENTSTYYGVEALAGLREYGIEVRVACSKEIEKHTSVFQQQLRSRIERKGITVVPEGNVVLRLTVTAITSDDGFFVVHFLLECLQTAYLARNNAPSESPVWDSYRMGEYREQDLLPAVDDLMRSFLNDYISVN